MGIFSTNIVAELNKFVEVSGIDGGGGVEFVKCGEGGFGGNVADEVVSRERTAAESREGAVKATTAGSIGGVDFIFGVFGAGVEMDAEFDTRDVVFYLCEEIVDLVGSGSANGVGERDGVDVNVL